MKLQLEPMYIGVTSQSKMQIRVYGGSGFHIYDTVTQVFPMALRPTRVAFLGKGTTDRPHEST